MNGQAYAVLVGLHGHLAWLGLVALVHPLLSLGSAGLRRGTVVSAWAAALLVALPFGLGWSVYPTYRSQVKPGLLVEVPAVALAFETKEHLAFFTVSLAVAAAVTLTFGGGADGARRLARTLLALALACGLVTAVLGGIVAATAHPGF